MNNETAGQTRNTSYIPPISPQAQSTQQTQSTQQSSPQQTSSQALQSQQPSQSQPQQSQYQQSSSQYRQTSPQAQPSSSLDFLPNMDQIPPPTRRENASENRNKDGKDVVTFERLQHIGILSTSNSGWNREVNIVAWNGRQPRLDIRDWNPAHTKMSRGVGLNAAETDNLKALLESFQPLQAGI